MRKCELVVLVVAVVLCIASATVHATTILVPSVEPTIQAGMDAASEGDTVLVAPGTYIGEGNRGLEGTGVNMVIMSETGAGATTLNCEGADNCFTFYSGEDSTTVVRGFTITNGYRSSNGGAIYVTDSAPIIEDCIFSNNAAGSNGGAIYYSYSPTLGVIRDCVFFGNTAVYRGGGIALSGCANPNVGPVIRDCVLYDNTVTAAGSATQGGGGIQSSLSTPMIVGCTLAGNASNLSAGGITGYGNTVTLTRSVVAYSTSGAGIYGVDADHCIIYGNAGDSPQMGGDRENLNVSPLFCDFENRDLTVCDDSPCVATDPENPWGEHIGALGAGCESCDTVVEDSTWGAIKALYR